MNVLAALFLLVLLGVGLTVLAPVLAFSLAIAIPLGCILLWLLPILLIANSDETTGTEKLAWILAIIFLSWFAWIFYFLLAPIKRRPHRRDYRYE
jgi:hypothetical protein